MVDAGMPFRWKPPPGPTEVPALSLACLLVRRSDLLSAGGLPGGYADGSLCTASTPFVDADLGFRLRAAGGRLTNDPRALAWCPFQDPRPMPVVRPVKGDFRGRWLTVGDRATFIDRWGPRLVRQVLLDAIAGAHRWSAAPLRVAVLGPLRLPSTGSSVDWDVMGPSIAGGSPNLTAIRADVVIVADPEADIRDTPTGLIRVAWVGATSPRYLDEFDLVVAATDADRDRIAVETAKRVDVAELEGPGGVDELRELLVRWAAARRLGIRIGPVSWRNAHLWGDYHFGRSLQRYLERAGHPTRVRLIGDWSTEAAAADDATVHVFGRHAAHNRPCQASMRSGRSATRIRPRPSCMTRTTTRSWHRSRSRP